MFLHAPLGHSMCHGAEPGSILPGSLLLPVKLPASALQPCFHLSWMAELGSQGSSFSPVRESIFLPLSAAQPRAAEMEGGSLLTQIQPCLKGKLLAAARRLALTDRWEGGVGEAPRGAATCASFVIVLVLIICIAAEPKMQAKGNAHTRAMK